MTEDTYRSIAPSIPPVTSGMLHAGLQHGYIAMKSDSIYYTIQAWCTRTYLAGLVRSTDDQGAFEALAHGYTHWASGRLE